MMFDSLVCPLSSDPEEAEEERMDSFEIFKGSTKSLCEEVLTTKTSLEDYQYQYDCEGKESSDPILTYLRRHYLELEPPDPLDSSTEPDLSWDEGDLPPLCPKVWTFNDFMEQYNNIYSWLNNIQVEYHSHHSHHSQQGHKTARVEVMLRELEKDVERRERFLRECGRMVGSYPELEEEVRWRLDHVMTKWDMLTQLRTKSRNLRDNIQDIYSDIELEVKCLRRWLREMEARIDPLQFSKILEWSARDRERKMAEYQVLQTDIESHGRIVKLVVGLCQDLSQDPGQYDLQHAVKVASGLERRWHQIWLRSLEWQCLLEQWLTEDSRDHQEGEGEEAALLDTEDEEPLAKVARLNTDCSTASSPAVTLLRKKKRKRMINLDLSPEETLAHIQDPEKRLKLKSPRTPRNLAESDYSDCGDQIVVSRISTTESDPSDPSAPSTSRSESSDCLTFVFSERKAERERERKVPPGDDNLNLTADQNDFINNTVSLGRKVTVILNTNQVENNMKAFSEDSLEEEETFSETEGSCSLTDVTGEEEEEEGTSSGEENINNPAATTAITTANNLEISQLHFGEDYRLFISSLSDSSVAEAAVRRPHSRYRRTKKLRRKNKRREGEECFPYESQSEAEMEEMFLVVTRSHRHIHLVEDRVTEYLSQGFVTSSSSSNLQEYDEILSNCSENINLLHNFLENIHTARSFVQRKKSRETRLLISRWEKLLQKLLDNVNHSKVFAQLKDDCKHLRERTAVLEDNLHCAISEVDLQSQMRKLKAIQEQLSGQKTKMDELIISVHNFLAELSSSSSSCSYVSDCHISLAGELKSAVVGLYSHWDSTSSRASSSLASTELAVTKLNNIERDLLEFRKSLRENMLSLQLSAEIPRKTKLKSSPTSQSLADSGISEGSSGWLSDHGLPGAVEQLARLREMARGLESSLSPQDPRLLALSNILHDTTTELSDLQKMYLKQKPSSASARGARVSGVSGVNGVRGVSGVSGGVRKKSSKSRPALAAQGRERQRGRRGGKFVRLAVSMQLMLVSLVFLSWLWQPQCCDNISAISPLSFSPHFNFVNGPPPI